MIPIGKYGRQGFLGPDSESILKASCPAIIGLGGGGSHVAQQLAHAGVGRFKLFDVDKTEEHNLNRNIGSEPQHAVQATMKVDVAADMILRINPKAIISRHYCNWEDDHMYVRDCDAAIGCVHTFAGRENLERYCRRYHLPYIDIGMNVSRAGTAFLISGQVITSLPGRPCMRCMGFITDTIVSDDVQRYGAAGGAPQVVWSNGVLASTAVGAFIRLRCNWTGQEPLLYVEYDGNRDLLSRSSRATLAEAHICPHYSSADTLGDVL
jgi:molybdopterin/thiamine biosynthesis adenylyltransferase